MPPKRLQLVQNIRDAYPEDLSAQKIEHWATVVIPLLDAYTVGVAKLRGSVSAGTASATTTPIEIVNAISQYQDIVREVYLSAEAIRTVIGVRLPEMKEEDNLGVAVQMAVLKLIDGLEGKILGGGGDEKSAPAVASLFSLKAYLSSRAAVEDKLIGKPSEDKSTPSGGSKAPSALLELRQVDVDALVKVELGAVQLAAQLRSFVNSYGLNWKKLIQPRVNNDRMVS